MPEAPAPAPNEADAPPPVVVSPLGLWERIKEHKILQWSLGYLGAALALAHGAELLGTAFHWPEAAQRLILGALIVGLPLVLTLAWYHGHKGLKGVSQGELMIASILIVIGAGLLIVLVRPSEGGAEAHSVPESATARSTAAANSPVAPRTAIAVMPFANLTGDASKDYLGDGMAEELINTLTKVNGLKVPARTSTFAYKGRNTDIRQIARDLGVGTILEGSVRAAGKRIRITAQLINAQDGLHLWSETYDEEFTDIFKLQDKLATEIARALQPSLGAAVQAIVAQGPPTQDLEAYQLYLQGSSLSDRITEQSEIRAIAYFQRALARDPVFARAYTGIATAHLRLGATLSLRPVAELAAAERAARQALALDANIASAQATLAVVNDLRGNRLEAEAHSLASLLLGSNDALVHSYRALHLMTGGRLRNAMDEARSATELAPANPWVIANLAQLYSLIGRDAESLKYAGLAAELGYPRYSEPLAPVFSDSLLHAGRYADAAEMAVKALEITDPEWARTAETIKLVHGALTNPGERARALAAAGRLYPPPTGLASGRANLTDVGPCLESSFRYTLLDALDAAYDLANQCLDRMAPSAVYAGRSNIHLWRPWLRPFRKDRRFQALATRMGYMEAWQQNGPPDDCELKDGKLTCH